MSGRHYDPSEDITEASLPAGPWDSGLGDQHTRSIVTLCGQFLAIRRTGARWTLVTDGHQILLSRGDLQALADDLQASLDDTESEVLS